MKNIFILFLVLSFCVAAQEKKNKQGILEKGVDEVYIWVTEMPEFPGGNDSLMNFIKVNLNWPGPECCEGTVYIKFIIEKDGAITNPVVMKGISGCSNYDKESLRIVKLFPGFKPGKMNGEAVRVWYHFPIRFRSH